jgi:hypothetical protein
VASNAGRMFKPVIFFACVAAALSWGYQKWKTRSSANFSPASVQSTDNPSNRIVLSEEAFARVENTLQATESGDKDTILSHVNQVPGTTRPGFSVNKADTQAAIALNANALRAFNDARNPGRAFALQEQALQKNPLSTEVLGNFAIYALASEQTSNTFYSGESAIRQAHAATVTALTLPQQSSTGRTADWATLAATYAREGDHQRAAQALYVTLAIAPDPAMRCYSALYSVKQVYGNSLQQATEAMIGRVVEQGLSRAPACRFPVDWALSPSQVKFETANKLTVNGINPVRIGFTRDQFLDAFQIRSNNLDCGNSTLQARQPVTQCYIRNNFLGDVDGSVLLDDSKVVGVLIRDMRVSTPSGIRVGSNASGITAAYGGKYEIRNEVPNEMRIMGTGSDSAFHLHFWFDGNAVITQMGALNTSTFVDVAPPALPIMDGENANDIASGVTITPGSTYQTDFASGSVSPELTLADPNSASNFRFRIAPVGGEVLVNVWAEGGSFSYRTASGGGSNLCQKGAWKAVSVENINAISLEVSVIEQRSPCK